MSPEGFVFWPAVLAGAAVVAFFTSAGLPWVACLVLGWIMLAFAEGGSSLRRPRPVLRVGEGRVELDASFANAFGPLALAAVPVLAVLAQFPLPATPARQIPLISALLVPLFTAAAGGLVGTVGLAWLGRRPVHILLDPERRRLSVRSAARRLTLAAGELAEVRAERHTLVLRHATGEERIRLPAEVRMAELVTALTAQSRRLGADPDAEALRAEATAALGTVRR